MNNLNNYNNIRLKNIFENFAWLMVLYWYYREMKSNEHYLVGIDGGGTGCRAVVCDSEGHRLGFGKAGPANIMTNFEGARDNIVEACCQAFREAGLDSAAFAASDAVLGLAGGNIADYADRMVKALPFRRCRMETDAQISLQGAIGDSDGVVAIIGTGSVFIYRTDGEVRTAGGWGFMVGDLGSGARLGRSLLQEALLVYDGIHEGSELTMHVLNRFQHDPQTIVEYAHSALPGEFGVFSPLIFEFAEKGDPTANAIVREAVSDVEETLNAIYTRKDQKLCLLGGLGTKYVDYLSDHIRQAISEPEGTAVDGAIALAMHDYSKAGAH